MFSLVIQQMNIASLQAQGLGEKYLDFLKSFGCILENFQAVEPQRVFFSPRAWSRRPVDYNQMLMLWGLLILKANSGAFKTFFDHWKNYPAGYEGFCRLEEALRLLVLERPRAIKKIGEEFGFRFDDGGYEMVFETERFFFFQVLPKGPVGYSGKNPTLVLPPYVLGPNILNFLSKRERSYVDRFAAQMPTYIRIVKDMSNRAVQKMTPEDDYRDTYLALQLIAQRHGGRKPSLQGYCQGGSFALCDALAGINKIICALVLCVAPTDGTKSTGLAGFLKEVPEEFRNLDYASFGQDIVSAEILSFIYKLKAIEEEGPFSSFWRGVKEAEKGLAENEVITGLSYWLANNKVNQPRAITCLSLDMYSRPISSLGDLGVEMFGRKLNLGELGVPLYVAAAKKDKLVEPACALALVPHVKNSCVSMINGGHVAAATCLDSEWEGLFTGPDPVRWLLSLGR